MSVWEKNVWKKVAYLVLGLGVGVALDQTTKSWMRVAVPQGTSQKIAPFLKWVHAWNPGVSFGLFPCHTLWERLGLLGIIAIISFFLIHWYWTTQNPWVRLGLTLTLAGALGNVWDRLVWGAVFDFILLHWKEWAFPAFNVADMLVSIGFLMLMYGNFQWKALRLPRKAL